MKHTANTHGPLTEPPNCDSRVLRLRRMRRETNATVVRTCGWKSVRRGSHERRDLADNNRVGFAIFDAARAEVRRRFAELRHRRYEEEQDAAPTAKPRSSKGRAKAVPPSQGALGLVDAPEAEVRNSKASASAKTVSTRSASR